MVEMMADLMVKTTGQRAAKMVDLKVGWMVDLKAGSTDCPLVC